MSGREEPLHPGGERAAADRLPGALLRALRVSYDFTAGWRTSSTTCPAAAPTGRRCSKPSGATSSPRPARSWSRSRPRSPRRSTSSSRPLAVPGQGGRHRPAPLPGLRRRPAGAARRQVRRVRRLLQLSRMQVHPPLRPGRRGGGGGEERPRSARPDPERARHHAQDRPLRPYVERARARRPSAPRSPRTCRRPSSTSTWAVKLLSLPRDDRRASGDGRADHRVDRPLRALSRA
jgi:hypothetical protein